MAPLDGAPAEEGSGLDEAGPLKLSASQLYRFSVCEMAWLLDRQRVPTGNHEAARPDYFLIGDAVHAGIQAWGVGRPWRDAVLAVLIEAEPWWSPEYEEPAWAQKALRIVASWVHVHGERPPVWWVATELPFDVEIPGAGGARVRGFLDGLTSQPHEDGIPSHGEYRITEIKTMGRAGRAKRVPYANDTWLYLWAARCSIPAVTGLDFEAISTYDYKPTGDADADAARPFSTVRVEWDERAAERMLTDLRRTAKRAAAITKNPHLAVRSVGDECGRCPHQIPCLRPWEAS